MSAKQLSHRHDLGVDANCPECSRVDHEIQQAEALAIRLTRQQARREAGMDNTP